MSQAKQTARELFLSGCNCSQSVFCAFSDKYGIERETALKISSGLGGGVGRQREVCGAVTGAALIIGLEYASGETDGKDKAAVYQKVQEFSELFKQSQPSIICRELLDSIEKKSFVPDERNDSYYKTRPCLRIIEDAVNALEKILDN